MIPNFDVYTDHAWITAIQTVMKVEEYLRTVPVIRLVKTADEAQRIFDCISYIKGGVSFIDQVYC